MCGRWLVARCRQASALSTSGMISGTVTGAPGSYNFTLQVADLTGCAGTRALTITVGCPTLTITPGTIATGTAVQQLHPGL